MYLAPADEIEEIEESVNISIVDDSMVKESQRWVAFAPTSYTQGFLSTH